MAFEEPTQFGAKRTVLTVTDDEVNDVSRWNYTSQTSALVMRASGRHSDHCGRGLTAEIYYASVGKSNALNSCAFNFPVFTHIFQFILLKHFILEWN